MANYCSNCGVSIPDGQKVCSICYGDPEYGADGYYKFLLKDMQETKPEQHQLPKNFGQDKIAV